MAIHGLHTRRGEITFLRSVVNRKREETSKENMIFDPKTTCPKLWSHSYADSDNVKLGKAIHAEIEKRLKEEACAAIGVGGQHSDEYFDDGACKWCGLRRFGK